MRKFLSVIILCSLVSSSFAQQSIKPVKGFKPPKLTTTLGVYKDSVGVSHDEALRIIKLPITVTDIAKGKYTISSYQFVYKKVNLLEDETGKKAISHSMVAQAFKTTPLSETWISSITEQLKSGELLWFTDIIARDAQGRIMYAPDVKISIK